MASDEERVICFTSDFGLEDAWVGICHGVIAAACPSSHVVDLAHTLAPYDVRKGAAVAAAGAYQLPKAVHLVVVDPGVGGARRDLCLVAASGTRLVGPDNGVLVPAALRMGGIAEAYAIDPTRLGAGEISGTFRARDVLAPAAAALSCGVSPATIGEVVDILTLAASPFGECRLEGAYVVGEVVDTDRFGSLRFNVPAERVDELGLRAARLEIGLGHNALEVAFGRTFSDVLEAEPVVLIDSSGWLTLCINKGSAADRYSIKPAAHVRLRAAP